MALSRLLNCLLLPALTHHTLTMLSNALLKMLRLPTSCSWSSKPTCATANWILTISKNSIRKWLKLMPTQRTTNWTTSKFLHTLHLMVVWNWTPVWLKTVKQTQKNIWNASWRRARLILTWMQNTLHKTGKASKNWYLNQTCRIKIWSYVFFLCTMILNKEKLKSRISLLYTKLWLTKSCLSCVVPV